MLTKTNDEETLMNLFGLPKPKQPEQKPPQDTKSAKPADGGLLGGAARDMKGRKSRIDDAVDAATK